jgi:hypothetical protein
LHSVCVREIDEVMRIILSHGWALLKGIAHRPRSQIFQAPSAAHRGLPVSGQSSEVHVPSAKISALPIEPHTLVVALCYTCNQIPPPPAPPSPHSAPPSGSSIAGPSKRLAPSAPPSSYMFIAIGGALLAGGMNLCAFISACPSTHATTAWRHSHLHTTATKGTS